MEREINTTLDNILTLISCARDYRFEDDVLFDAFAEMMGYKLSEEEIEVYSRSILEDEDYGEEDYEQIKSRLIEFKEKYINNSQG